MTDKTWTATDLELGKLTINRNNSTLHIERRYRFLDASLAVMTEIATGRLLVEVEVGDVPPDILAALQAIDAWTKTQALVQEGMN